MKQQTNHQTTIRIRRTTHKLNDHNLVEQLPANPIRGSREPVTRPPMLLRIIHPLQPNLAVDDRFLDVIPITDGQTVAMMDPNDLAVEFLSSLEKLHGASLLALSSDSGRSATMFHQQVLSAATGRRNWWALKK